ncbi:MAG TPA: PRD domain-containing protein [Anaerolineales bacterium]|nr:PRD domain-containing protein [Anaerolineales bacterium]
MITFTTRQREILRIILDANRPIGSIELAKLLKITPRQVNYSMKGVKVWLQQNGQDLHVLPGVGFQVDVTPDQSHALVQKISVHSGVQIILSVSQRQQLLALFLLSCREPVILAQLEQLTHVSRMTILKDLDVIEAWLANQDIQLVRKPHFGIQISGGELECQQAMVKLLWGETAISLDPITEITHADGLTFTLRGDARLLPLVAEVNEYLSGLKMRRSIGLVAKAEEQLGGRFTDDAVLHLALVFAVKARRVLMGSHLVLDEALLNTIQSSGMWTVATYIAGKLGRETNATWTQADTAGLAMEMMSAPRNEVFPGELEHESGPSEMYSRLLDHISQLFNIPKLKNDHTLLKGLVNNIVPACYRQQFKLWFPVELNNASLPERYEQEYVVAQQISEIVFEYTAVRLPKTEINSLAVLLRAAYIRNRPYRFERVIIICPSGMATAQLLMARLHARFPNLSNMEVVSLRDLTSSLISSADLILTTVPLSKQYTGIPKVIQVHPLLMPEDIETITRFLSQ